MHRFCRLYFAREGNSKDDDDAHVAEQEAFLNARQQEETVTYLRATSSDYIPDFLQSQQHLL